MILLLVLVLAIGALCYGFLAWARRQGYVAAPAAGPQPRHVPMLAEALGYVGVVLVLAGGIAAVARRWSDIADWGHVVICLAATVLFVTVGAVLRASPDPALQRLIDVVWFLSAAALAGAGAAVTSEIWQLSGQVAVLVVGVLLCAWSALLWSVRGHAAELGALFLSTIVLSCGVVATAGSGHASSLAFAATLWALGIGWAVVGWRRLVEPIWVAMPLGIVLALVAPTIAVDAHGWVFAVAIATAAGVMVAGLMLRNTPMLALGALALFGYLTGVVVRYFADSLGVPAALALTGVLVLVLAAVSGRLVRTMRKPEPGRQPPERPVHGRAR